MPAGFSAFTEVIDNITRRIKELENREATPAASSTVAGLPAPNPNLRGRFRFVTDARKLGEGAGDGTGVMAYDDGSAWRRASDDTTVVA